MSKYDDGKSMFLSPKVTQYDNHMVMTNVTKPSKIKYVNIDTRFREEYSDYAANSLASCSISLPERITEVKSIKVRNAEIPLSMYNISAAIGNNCFQIVDVATTPPTKTMIVIPDGQYTTTLSIFQAIAIATTAGNINLFYSISPNSKSILSANTGSVTVNFAVKSTGEPDAYNFKQKLGWLLGFRNPSYIVNTSGTTSEAVLDLNGSRYLYLVLDEFTRGNQNSFIAPLPSSLLRKSILARISMDPAHYSYGKILTANNYNGLLLTDTREYTGRVDLQKLSIQLVDEFGNPVSLNGLDYSFCLEVEHE